MKTLRQVGVGQTVTVKRLHGEGPVKRRIMDMGITKGVQIYVRKVAPLGDPIEVTVRDYELSPEKSRCRNDRGRISTVQDIVLCCVYIMEKLLVTYF